MVDTIRIFLKSGGRKREKEKEVVLLHTAIWAMDVDCVHQRIRGRKCAGGWRSTWQDRGCFLLLWHLQRDSSLEIYNDSKPIKQSPTIALFFSFIYYRPPALHLLLVFVAAAALWLPLAARTLCRTGAIQQLTELNMSLPLLVACSMPILTSPALSRDEVVVEQWGQWEGVFPGPAAGNPFVDTTFKVAFTAPSHETTVVRGFYDGGGRYKVRYMPPAVGKWSYKTTSNVAELDGEVGTFEVTRAGGHIHGPVVVAKKNSTQACLPPRATPTAFVFAGTWRVFTSVLVCNVNYRPYMNPIILVVSLQKGTKFAYADGAPIFVVATTVYGLFINSSTTLSTLKTAPFNKVRTTMGSVRTIHNIN